MQALVAGGAVVLALALPSVAGAAPIPTNNTPGIPTFSGEVAAPQPVRAPLSPPHPFMAPNERSNLHSDAYQTDTNTFSGPLGDRTEVFSSLQTADCASVTFDTRGRIVTVCVGIVRPTLTMFDAKTLDVLATMPLPERQPSPPSGGGSIFNDFAGGGYFYLDGSDRAIIPTTTRHIYVVRADAEPGFTLEKDFDLTSVLPQGDKIISALPDWDGLLWFASTRGVVGTLDMASGRVRVLDTGEPNGNSFAVDDDGAVYIVTDAAMYRFEAGADGTPRAIWRHVYDNVGVQKPGQASKGSGTTPTVMDGGLVAITDNADPMNVLVLKRGRRVSGDRVVCKQPVFKAGASATDNSLIAAGRSLVVENNYGYTGPTSVENGQTTAPGVTRIDLDDDGVGCRVVWESGETSPTVVPKLSLGNGLVYVYTKPPNQPGAADAWYLTAIDFATGKTRWSRLTGEGIGYNNNYAPVTIGPDGTAYIGTLGGLVGVRDAAPPAQGADVAAGTIDDRLDGTKPRMVLRLRRSSTGRLVLRLTGRDAGLVRRAIFRVSGRGRAVDRRAPFSWSVSLRGLSRKRDRAIRVGVVLDNGETFTLRRTLRRAAR